MCAAHIDVDERTPLVCGLESAGRASEGEDTLAFTGGNSFRSRSPPAELRVGVSGGRWYVLLVLCLVNAACVVNWQPLLAVPDHGIAYLGVDAALYQVFNYAFLFLTLPVMPVGAYVCDRFGLRAAMLAGAATLALGGLLKLLVWADVWLAHTGFRVPLSPYHRNSLVTAPTPANSTIDHLQRGLLLSSGPAQWLVLAFGQLLCAASQPLVGCLSGKMSHDWFESSWTGFATNLPNQMVPVGIMTGNLLAPFLVKSPAHVPRLFLLTGLVSVVPILFAVGVRRSRPERPPSEERVANWSADQREENENLLWRTCAALKLPCFWPLLIAFGIMIGVFDAITSLIYQLLCASGYNEQFASVSVSLLIVAGLVCSILAMRLDQKVVAVPGLKLLFAGVTAGVLLFAFVSQVPHAEPPLVFALVLCGVCMSTAYGFAIEWGAELAERHQLTPLVPVMLLVASTEFFGLLLAAVSSSILSLAPPASPPPSASLTTSTQATRSTASATATATAVLYSSSAAGAAYQCYESLCYNILMSALMLVATLLMFVFFRPPAPSNSSA